MLRTHTHTHNRDVSSRLKVISRWICEDCPEHNGASGHARLCESWVGSSGGISNHSIWPESSRSYRSVYIPCSSSFPLFSNIFFIIIYLFIYFVVLLFFSSFLVVVVIKAHSYFFKSAKTRLYHQYTHTQFNQEGKNKTKAIIELLRESHTKSVSPRRVTRAVCLNSKSPRRVSCRRVSSSYLIDGRSSTIREIPYATSRKIFRPICALTYPSALELIFILSLSLLEPRPMPIINVFHFSFLHTFRLTRKARNTEEYSPAMLFQINWSDLRVWFS